LTIKNGLKIFTQKVLRRLKIGINQKRVYNGIENTQRNVDSERQSTENQIVKNAVTNLLKKLFTMFFVTLIVNKETDTNKDWITKLEHAFFVAINFQSINVQKEKIVSLNVTNERHEEVYDLTVEDEHEYFANGILVHNCLDSARMVVLKMRDEGIIKIV